MTFCGLIHLTAGFEEFQAEVTVFDLHILAVDRLLRTGNINHHVKTILPGLRHLRSCHSRPVAITSQGSLTKSKLHLSFELGYRPQKTLPTQKFNIPPMSQAPVQKKARRGLGSAQNTPRLTTKDLTSTTSGTMDMSSHKPFSVVPKVYSRVRFVFPEMPSSGTFSKLRDGFSLSMLSSAIHYSLNRRGRLLKAATVLTRTEHRKPAPTSTIEDGKSKLQSKRIGTKKHHEPCTRVLKRIDRKSRKTRHRQASYPSENGLFFRALSSISGWAESKRARRSRD